ncbi:HAD family hydrolase [Marinobacterium sp. xm-d-530]|uniref:HAD family hydrolase n=1 Tax=Marinobacterium sp. xm-d-530 TaxID=2497747 RepID=UPI0019EB1DF2|nr:HAD family hydrolase [Marinobacterium sp. xm-d-530]NRQ01570.1 Phosphoglycolate phosphatase [Marinobacterium sp. xm-d-530]
MNHIRGIVFDLDGTLVTSTLDFNQIRLDIGCPADVDVLSFVETLSLPERADAEAIIHQHEVEKNFSLPNPSIMMVGDYKYDLEAGRNANMSTCLVNCEGEPDYLHLSDHRYSSFIHLHSAFFAGR